MVKEEASMRKNTLALIILALVLVLICVGSFFALKLQPSNNGSSNVSSETPKAQVLSLTSANISEITVATSTENYTLKRKDTDSFVFPDKEGIALDKTNVDSLIVSISDLQAISVTDSANLADFGLATPSSKVTIKLNDGKTNELLLGNKSIKGDVYIKTNSSNEVFALDSYTAESFTVKKLSFYDKTIPTGLTAENFVSVKIERATADTISIIKTNQPVSSDLVSAGQVSYVLEKPITSELDVYTFSEDIIKNLTNLSIIDTISDDFSIANLKKYSLDAPKYTLNYSFDKNNITLLIGNLNSDGNYYCIRKGTELIYTISKTNLSFLDITVTKIASKLQYSTNIKDVNSVKIEGQGKSYTFTIIGSETDNMQVKYNDKELVAEDFRTLYQNIIGIYQNGLATNKPKVKAEITITFTLKNGKADVLNYIPYDFMNYYFTINGEGVFTVSKDSVLKVLTNAEKYINGEKITA